MTDKPKDGGPERLERARKEQEEYFPEGDDPLDVRSANYWILQSNEAWECAGEHMMREDALSAEVARLNVLAHERMIAINTIRSETRRATLEEAAKVAEGYGIWDHNEGCRCEDCEIPTDVAEGIRALATVDSSPATVNPPRAPRSKSEARRFEALAWQPCRHDDSSWCVDSCIPPWKRTPPPPEGKGEKDE